MTTVPFLEHNLGC